MSKDMVAMLLGVGAFALWMHSTSKNEKRSKSECIDILANGIVTGVKTVKTLPGAEGTIQRSFFPMVKTHLANLGLIGAADCLEQILTTENEDLARCRQLIREEIIESMKDGIPQGREGLPVLHQWLLTIGQKEAADCLTELTGVKG